MPFSASKQGEASTDEAAKHHSTRREPSSSHAIASTTGGATQLGNQAMGRALNSGSNLPSNGRLAIQAKLAADRPSSSSPCEQCEPAAVEGATHEVDGPSSALEGRGLQAKLAVSSPDDPLEREADAVAERVTRQEPKEAAAPIRVQELTQPGISRMPVWESPGDPVVDSDDGPAVAEVQAKLSATHTKHSSQHFSTAVRAAGVTGQPLAPSVRTDFEGRFGHDFGHVRVHSNEAAHAAVEALQAHAFTIGPAIFFGRGMYNPTSGSGRQLLAHELTHVLQQRTSVPGGLPSGARSIQRQESQSAGSRPSPAPHATNVVIAWRGSLRASLFAYLRRYAASEEDAARATNAVVAAASRFVLGGRELSREEWERQMRTAFVLTPEIIEVVTRELHISPEQLESRLEGDGTEDPDAGRAIPAGVARAAEHEARSLGPVASTSADWTVFDGNVELSQLYLQLMEHYAALPITPANRAAAAGGLTIEELNSIVGGDRRLQHFTDLISQGFAEFTHAGPATLEVFSAFEERILEQFVWGNPTAVRNQLKIGVGWPEQTVGIVERTSGLLLYDETATPLPSFAGTMMRDPGFVGAPQSPSGLNIANIEDPGLRALLNSLRQQFGDPTRMVAHAASTYFDNIELVNARVRVGLSGEVKRRFAEALPVFVGFLAGHGLSTLLMASANPIGVGAGLALRGLLVAAGYVLEIDFLGSSLAHLLEAAGHLTRVRKDSTGTLTELSTHHLDAAATIIRAMVADVALTLATVGLTRLLRGRTAIECSRCRFRRRRTPERRLGAVRQRGEGESGTHSTGSRTPRRRGRLTSPSTEPNPIARPEGPRTRIPEGADEVTQRSLGMENDAADALSREGYHVEQNPNVPGSRNPDLRIEGNVFDVYSPEYGTPARNIFSVIRDKVLSGQTTRVVLNLRESNVSVPRLIRELTRRRGEAPGLLEVLVVRNGHVRRIYP